MGEHVVGGMQEQRKPSAIDAWRKSATENYHSTVLTEKTGFLSVLVRKALGKSLS